MKNQHKTVSKMISLILRHHPKFIGATLDRNGWLSVDELIRGVNEKGHALDRTQLDEIVFTNDKKRFAFSEDGARIRANQGHSIAVDVELNEVTPPRYLYHGTVEKFMGSIREEGLRKMNRQHVHLSKDLETARSVGARRGNPKILTVRAGEMRQAGHSFFLSANGVWLTDHVPSKYIELSK